MIDLIAIENEIKDLTAKLQEKRRAYAESKEYNLKEQYGDDFGCNNCAYSCCVDVGDYHTSCVIGHCIYCRNYCDEYMPENELSTYVREYHYYDEHIISRLGDMLDVSDIMKHPELHQTALEILKLKDKKENAK